MKFCLVVILKNKERISTIILGNSTSAALPLELEEKFTCADQKFVTKLPEFLSITLFLHANVHALKMTDFLRLERVAHLNRKTKC